MNFNKAFTMAEALIVLGVVGILASLSVVAVNSSKPDENIIMFRRGYATAAKVTQSMLNDPVLYPKANDAIIVNSRLGGSVDNKYGLLDSTGQNGNNFALNFRLLVNPVSLDTNNTNRLQQFTTGDGIYWEVTCVDLMTDNKPYAYITMSLFGKTGAACSYNAASCQQPTKFTLRVDKSGSIKPVLDNGHTFDPVAATYLYYSKINKHSKIPRDTRWFT